MSESDRLYELLPAVLRTRDAEVGSPLRALAAILSDEIRAIEADVETTWDNWFIETCEEWLVPYIGEALGVRGLRDIDAAEFSIRAYVANTLERRRRKGTIAATEEMARDVTGYPARAVEMFALTATNVNVNHTRMPPAGGVALGTVDVRDRAALLEIGGAFDPHVHTPDLRSLGSADNQVRHNLANVVIFLWRVRSQELVDTTARRDPADPRWYRFDALGADRNLFNLPVGESSIRSLAGAEHVPRPLTRFELEASALAGTGLADWPLAVRTITGSGGGATTVELAMHMCDLSDAGGGLPSREPENPGEVLVDPVLGRIAMHPDDLPAAATPFEVVVDHAIGWPGRVGAGPDDRNALLERQLAQRAVTFQCGVSRTVAAVGGELIAPDLDTAIAAWNTHVASLPVGSRSDAVGVVAVLDSRTYDAPAAPIELPDGSLLALVAARWPETEVDGVPDRHTGEIDANALRPHLIGPIRVQGSSNAAAPTTGGLVLNGLLLEGRVQVDPGDLGRLDIAACTITGPPTSVEILSTAADTNGGLAVTVERSVTRRVAASRPMAGVDISDSFVGASPHAIDVEGTRLDIRSATVRGAIRCHVLEATDSILDEGDSPPVDALRIAHTQEGCIRFSYAPFGASTPQRYRCQPDLALDGVTDPTERQRIISVIRPNYSTILDDPGFGLLRPDTPQSLRTASSDGSEPGMWHHLQHARRMANLRMALRQDLRFGLDAGVVLDN